MGDGEILSTHLKTNKMIAEKYSARHFLRTQQAFGQGYLGNEYSAPGPENPADCLTKVRSDAAPLLRPLESGHFNPGSPGPLKWGGLEGKSGPWQAGGLKFACAHSGRGWSAGELIKLDGWLGCKPALGLFGTILCAPLPVCRALFCLSFVFYSLFVVDRGGVSRFVFRVFPTALWRMPNNGANSENDALFWNGHFSWALLRRRWRSSPPRRQNPTCVLRGFT